MDRGLQGAKLSLFEGGEGIDNYESEEDEVHESDNDDDEESDSDDEGDKSDDEGHSLKDISGAGHDRGIGTASEILFVRFPRS